MDTVTPTIAGGPAKGLTPSAIVRYLDQYVIGQDQAKRAIAVAVYAHYKKLARSRDGSIAMGKSNILMVGPTGCGKTLICETLSRGLGVPFVTADATSLAHSKYVNEEIEAVLRRLIERAGGDVQRAQRGIVFIDEIDKLKSTGAEGDSSYGERVQHALLKIMEGARVKLGGDAAGKFGDIDTTDILFICGGAFVGLDKITAKSHSYGFIATSPDDDPAILERLNARTKPTDLLDYGLIPEFTGRLPIIANLKHLTQDLLVRVMTEPRNSIAAQFREILRNEGVDLVIEPIVYDQVAELAIEYKVGARSLRGIFEELVGPILYQVPDRPEVKRVTIRSVFQPAVFDTGA